MATKEVKQPRRRATPARNKGFNIRNYLIGAAIIAFIALPFVLEYFRSANLPGTFYRSQGNVHIAQGAALPNYNSNPPTSGPHYANIASWGAYDYELPDPLLVHNMEDGGVILWYRLGTPEENQAHMELLREASSRYRRVVIVPRDGLETTYAMTAWTRLDTFNDFDAERIQNFLRHYEGIDHHPRG